jgi:hypothetical protein
MGYFERKRSRNREGTLKAAARVGRIDSAVEVAATEPFEEWRFVRLAVPAWHWGTGEGQGIFRVAGHVQDKVRLTEEQGKKLAAMLAWFNKRLPVPRVSNPKAIFWFKFSATECRRRVTQLARLLRELGVGIVITETNQPGKVVYEDAFQVAAIPSEPDLSVNPDRDEA